MRTDQQIQHDVQEELKWQPFLNAAQIGVGVKDGIVTLSGTVDSYSKKLAAERAAKTVKGVRAIAEDIEVRVVPGIVKSDTDIASAALQAVKWHSMVQDEKLKLKVDNGWVTLEGEAEWGFQKEAAASAIENLAGVKGVINNISVKPRVEIKDVKRQVSLAFHRSATIDADKIDVQTTGDTVVLTGNVRSLAEKRDAEKAAWLAPGVRGVDNRLSVSLEVLAM